LSGGTANFFPDPDSDLGSYETDIDLACPHGLIALHQQLVSAFGSNREKQSAIERYIPQRYENQSNIA
jgi:hypothetical protein